jgi:hypothetical protein
MLAPYPLDASILVNVDVDPRIHCSSEFDHIRGYKNRRHASCAVDDDRDEDCSVANMRADKVFFAVKINHERLPMLFETGVAFWRN